MPNFVTVNREQRMLLPPDLREWVREDDLVHFVIEAVEGMELGGFCVNERGTGSEQYPPHMMLALLIYCYANGIFSSRRIEAASWRDIAVRYLTADTHPDHDTICKFRRENFEAVAQCFVGVLELARELKLLKVGVISVDGTKLDAAASKHRNVTYERAGELIAQLEGEVRELLQKAEAADVAEEQDPGKLPQEIARREKLKAKLEQARKELEERARRRAESERADYERKVAEREARQGSAKGRIIPPPDPTPKAEAQINLSDADSGLMRRSKAAEYRQAYNPQAAVDAEGSQLVLGARVSQCASDANELVADVRSVPPGLGKIQAALADSGFANGAAVAELEQAGVEVYVSIGAEAAMMRRKHDFRPAHRRREKIGIEPKTPWKIAMKARLETEQGRCMYARRKSTVEPVFGIIKEAMGFRRFLLRGIKKVEGEWTLVALAYNFRRLWKLKAEFPARRPDSPGAGSMWARAGSTLVNVLLRRFQSILRREFENLPSLIPSPTSS